MPDSSALPNGSVQALKVADHSPSRVLVLFHLGDQLAAFPMEDVERIAPMAELARPAGLPSVVEGILNWSGRAVPVLRLDRLLPLPSVSFGLYSMLIVLRGVSDGRVAIPVDRVSEIVTVLARNLLQVSAENSFNGCSQATVLVKERPVPILSPARILVQRERETLSEFGRVAQMRLQNWEAGNS
jgi:purine-binding chemotaxis protein CheW